jgi:amino acid adenylation domain-containing protein
VSETKELLDSLAKQGVVFWGEGSRLRFRASKGTLTEALRSQLASQKDSVLGAWRERAAQNVVSHPAAHGQRASWFLHQSHPGSGAYNMVFSVRVRSAIDLAALRRSFQALVDRHPSLRTTFSDESDGLVQRVHGWMPVCFAVHDRSGIDLPRLREEIYEASQAPFDLRTGPLMRVDLFKRSADDQVLLVTIHHIAADGWSVFLLLDDLRRLYPAERNGGAAPPPRPASDILQHTRWQEAMLAGPEGQEHEAYWLSKLAGVPTPLSMPTDRPRSVSFSERGATLPIDLGIDLSGAVRALAAQEGATPFVVLLTAYQILLHRYTGQHEVIVGSPAYGRDRPEFADVVGLLVNMIPLKATFNDDPPLRELLARTRQAVVEGIQHQDYPFPLLVEKLHPDRDFSRTPVFQTVFNLQKYRQVAGLEALLSQADSEARADFGGLVLEPFPILQQEGQLELSVELAEKDGTYKGVIKYDPDLFDVSTMRRLSSHYATLLRSIVASPERSVSQLPLLERTEREWLVAGLNATDRVYARERTVVDLIREQVIRRAEAKAVSFEGDALTYSELDIRSTRLARHIQALGVGPESLVCLCVERGLEMMVGVLAVLKAGGAYVPLDPAFPAERLRYMVEDSGAKVLVTQKWLSEALFSGLDLVRVYLDDDKDQIGQQSSKPLPRLAGPSNRAYVLYTSGSTGRPKGVEIEHRALTNFLSSMAREPGLTEEDVLLAVTTLGFDIAGLELFLPLITGARIELASRETALDGVALGRILSTSGATVMQATPATWRMLFDSGWQGDRCLKVLCGGEAWDRDLAARLVSTCGSVWNMYGPTETTIWSSAARMESDELTIGRPIANTRMYVLDGHREPVPHGVVGELWIGGEGVARGYLNRTELTGERFIEDPFHEGERMYRTGDLARHLQDGRLECLGRIDNQVKIRGYRIELGEIEAALSTHEGVRNCVVAARKEHSGDVRLLAYVVPNDDRRPAIEDLRAHLRTVLPDYMIPSAFAFLDAVPLTPNGKVDRNALPIPGADLSDLAVDYVAPRNHVERVMTEIWAEVLGVRSVGVFNDFFELGGHSLLATRLISRIRAALDLELSIRNLFEAPTIAGLVQRLNDAQAARSALQPLERPAEIPLSFAQRRLWFLDRLEGPGATYNIPLALRLTGPLDCAALEASLNDLVERHESLRTVFPETLGVPRQLILEAPNARPTLTVQSVTEDTLGKSLAAAAQTGFDLSTQIPLRVQLFALSQSEHVLLLILHHIAGDGWSLAPLVRDLACAYAARCQGAAPQLPALPVQYADYTLWQQQTLGDETDPDGPIARQIAFWTKTLEGLPEQLELPTDRPRPAVASYRGDTVPLRLEPELHGRLLTLARDNQVSLFMVLQAGLATLLSRLGAGTDIPIGSPIAGRTDRALEELVGFFVNTLVLRTDTSANPSFGELLARVREVDLAAYAHQELPFERLVEILNPPRSLAHQPLFQVMLAFQNAAEARLKLPGIVATLEPVATNAAKFDLCFSLGERRAPDGTPEGIQGAIEYRTDLFERRSVEAIATRLLRLLEAACADPQQPIGRLELLAFEERRQILFDWNDTACEVPHTTLPALFEAQVKRSPDTIALVFEESALTYAQLNARANRLAHCLIDQGIGPESLVALALPRSIEMVVGLLGILKTGGAYLPLDPAFPAERLRHMVEDSGAKVLVTHRALSEALFSGLNLVRMYLDDDKDQIDQRNSGPLPALAEPSNRAYVIYTSGSTGRPKGVEIGHRALTNFLCSMTREPGLKETDVLLAVTTLAFDIAGLELFLPLITGAQIELASRATALDGVALTRALSTSGATVMQATPATWRILFESGWTGDRRLKVLCGGEAMDRDLAARLVSTCGSVWNMYGPTETTIWSSVARIESDEVTMGRPIANTRMYVLDGHRGPVPQGVVGELWIGGEGVARGYLNRTELTRERFIEDPFHEGERMYRTGDLARHLPDGRLECLGRIDNQVKIRGYRIELGEIEATLSTHEGVRDCVVIARKEHTGDARLLAYVVPNDAHRPTIEDLRTHLMTVLPDYMIPSAFAFLDAIPLTPNGKIDRSALPIPGADLSDLSIGYVAPRNQVEHIMAEIWADVLGVKKVGVFDHFFELGGHSLSATRLIARLKSAFQIDLPLRSIFIEPTVAGLSKHLLYDEFTQRYYHVGEISRWHRLVPAQPKGSRLPLFIVAGFMDADDTLRVLSRLIPHLGLDQPVYGFQPRWLDGHSERYSGAEEIASEFLADLRSVQPKGPYLLGGDCAGGIVALATARELLRLGEEVRLLIMFDTYRPSFLSALGLRLYNAMGRGQHILNVIGGIIRASGTAKLQLIRELGRRKLKPAQTLSGEELAFHRIYRLRMDYMQTMYRYRLKKYQGRIALIVNELQYKLNKNMGWKGVASGGLQIHSTPGDHWTRYLHGEEMAKRLLGCLERAQAGGAEGDSSNHGTGTTKGPLSLNSEIEDSSSRSSSSSLPKIPMFHNP